MEQFSEQQNIGSKELPGQRKIGESETMNIDAKPGTRIIFAYPKNCNETDQEVAQKYLTSGVSYTVEKIDAHDWRTDVFLREFPGVAFNSSFFREE